MSHSHQDDPQDQIEASPASAAPESVAKRPLGFEQEVAPPDPRLTGRRLFLKLSLLGAAATLLPAAARALSGGTTGTGSGNTPVVLPYRNTLPLSNQPAVLSDLDGATGNYVVSGSGDLYIDTAGNIFLSNIQAHGTYVSGALNVGPISAVQPMAAMAGKYTGTTVNAATTVLYSDNNVKQQPATLQLAGDLYQGGGNLQIGVEFQAAAEPGGGVGVEVGWSRTICC
jgi:hypothetical protein